MSGGRLQTGSAPEPGLKAHRHPSHGQNGAGGAGPWSRLLTHSGPPSGEALGNHSISPSLSAHRFLHLKVAVLVKAFCLYKSKTLALKLYTFKIEIEDSVC